jgi:endonuclease G
MAPSAPIGRRYGKRAQDNTFLMTNMAPQLPGLNQRGWEALESVISSDYAEDFGEVWVLVGPIFEGQCRELLSGVRIPSHCYMIVVDINEVDNTVRALAVIMPQRRINGEPLSDFVVTVDVIEARTGLDFLSELSDAVENQLEASDPGADWNTAQVLQPRFGGTARTLKNRPCNQ